MKHIKKWLCLCTVLCLLFSFAPFASAEEISPDDERFAGKSWEEVIEAFLKEHYVQSDRVGLGYYNTVTGEEVYFNPDTYYIAASMFKVPLNMLFCEMISKGEMDWNTDVRGYRYEYLLRSTIIDSNNDMAELLWRAYGQGQWVPYRYYREQIAPYMGEDAEKVDDIYYKNNLFTARQMITCLKLLYENPERFPRLLDTMKEAEPNRYFLNHPQKVEVAHKYGYVVENDYLYLNDCGVCYTEDPIIIVAFTMGCHEPYKLLADYCTLMIDYTEYHTAERHRQELEEARQAAILAMNKTQEAPVSEPPEPVESAAPVQGAAAPAPTAAPKQEESMETTQFPIATILVLIIALAAVVAVLHGARKKKLKALWGVLAVAFAALAMITAFSARRQTPAISKPSTSLGDPTETVRSFFDAVAAQKYDKAYEYLYDYASLGLEQKPEGEAAQLMSDALRQSYGYSLYGDCRVNGADATQQVLLEVLDLTALQADLKEGTEAAVKKMSEELPQSQLVDGEGNYLPEITEKAYLDTLRELLAHPEKYRTVAGIEVKLRYTVEGWRMLTSRELLNALSGRTAYVGGGDRA